MRLIVESAPRSAIAMSHWDDVTQLVIDPEEIIYLAQEMAKLHEEQEPTDWYTSIGILAEKYPGDPDRVFCISERFRCLRMLMNNPRMQRWSITAIDDPDCNHTNGAVFRAVAKCPLRRVEERLHFDADDFFRIVLEEAEVEGHA
jgi:hypothetical protein